MSHAFSTEAADLKDITLLLRALEALGFTIEENTTIRSYPGDPMLEHEFRYVARNPTKAYDVGIDLKDGKVPSLTADYDFGGLKEHLGKNYNKLRQQYGEEALKQMARSCNGKEISRTVNKVKKTTHIKLQIYV